MNRREELKRYIKERGWGPVGSMLFHFLIVLLLVGFANNEYNPQESVGVEITLTPKITEEPPQPTPDPLTPETPLIPQLEQPIISLENYDNKAVTMTEDFEMPGNPNVNGGYGAGNGGGIGSGDASDGLGFEVAFAKSPLIMKGLYSSRRAGGGNGGRMASIKKYNGSSKGEEAVVKALRWLKEHQNADGSWTGANSPTAMCGLALLCYMAHGETPSSKEFGVTVEKAIKYLLYAQESNGRFKNAGANYSYGHALATYALSESYGMTQMVFLKEPMEKAVQIIIDGQQAGGAFDYNYAKGARKDMSVTAWQVQALKAAKMAGAENIGLQECLYKCVDGVKSFAGIGGGFGYNGAGNTETLGGAGALSLIFLDRANDKEVTDTFKITKDILPAWPKDGGGTYGWYYMTQSNYQHGGDIWESWNKAMLPMLVKNQQADGHWLSGSTHGSCDVYDTCLCCLTLEVYYRYLPTMIKIDETPRKVSNQNDDAKISAQITL